MVSGDGEDGVESVEEGWVPMEMLPRKVKRGSWASSSNLCWQFCIWPQC